MVLFVVSAVCELESSQLSPSSRLKCAPCEVEKLKRDFCESSQDPTTCECRIKKIASCPPGTNRVDIATCRKCGDPGCRCKCGPCQKPSSPFCRNVISEDGTCQCKQECCRLAPCEKGFERRNCKDCYCQCKPVTRTTLRPKECAACPKSRSPFCEVVGTPDCKCVTRCCSLAPCPRGTERQNCKSCFCPCTKLVSSTAKPNHRCSPCPKPPSPFCEFTLMPDCRCIKRCCSLAPCPRGSERKNCTSCSCPCQRITSSSQNQSQFEKTLTPACGQCPKSKDPLCEIIATPDCRCLTKCCKLAACPRGTERRNCKSCNCPCVRIVTENRKPLKIRSPCSSPSCRRRVDKRKQPESYNYPCKSNVAESSKQPVCQPCPKSKDPFCENILTPDCRCITQCCSLTACPEGTERKNCTSCNCPCQPTSQPLPELQAEEEHQNREERQSVHEEIENRGKIISHQSQIDGSKRIFSQIE